MLFFMLTMITMKIKNNYLDYFTDIFREIYFTKISTSQKSNFTQF